MGRGASKIIKINRMIATSSNQKTVSLLAMTDWVDEILTRENTAQDDAWSVEFLGLGFNS